MEEEQEAHQQWAEEFRQSRRTGFGEAAARYIAARNVDIAAAREDSAFDTAPTDTRDTKTLMELFRQARAQARAAYPDQPPSGASKYQPPGGAYQYQPPRAGQEIGSGPSKRRPDSYKAWPQHSKEEGKSGSHDPTKFQPGAWDGASDPLVATAQQARQSDTTEMFKTDEELEAKSLEVARRQQAGHEELADDADILELGDYGYNPAAVRSTRNPSSGNPPFRASGSGPYHHHRKPAVSTIADVGGDGPPAEYNFPTGPAVWDNLDMDISRSRLSSLQPSGPHADVDDDYEHAMKLARNRWDDSPPVLLGHASAPTDFSALTPEQQLLLDMEVAQRLQDEEYGIESVYGSVAAAHYDSSNLPLAPRLDAVSHRLDTIEEASEPVADDITLDLAAFQREEDKKFKKRRTD